MAYVILIGMMIAAVVVLIWNRRNEFDRKIQFLIHAFAFGVVYFAATWSGLLPHAIVLGIVIAIAACISAIYEHKLFTRTLLIPFVVPTAAVLALFTSQWQNPNAGDLVAERRLKPVIPNEVKPLVPQPAPVPVPAPIPDLAPIPSPEKPSFALIPNAEDLLAKPWSTSDEFSNWPVTRLLVRLSVIAYEPSVDAREIFTKWGYESESIGTGSMNGYIVKFGDSVVIAFRGTENSFYDAIQDAFFFRTVTPQGDIHGGFYKGYQNMHAQTQKLLVKYKPKRVWITGHSLGGSLAVVCAYRLLQDNEYPIAGVMTFGQPMVVKQNMADYLEPKLKGKYAHFVNEMDPVPNMVKPYVHFGHLVWMKDSEIYRSKDGMANIKNSTQQLFGAVQNPKPKPKLKPMTQTELKQSIANAKQKDPEFDPTAPMKFKGEWLEYDNHYKDAYLNMVDQLIDNPTGQQFLDE